MKRLLTILFLTACGSQQHPPSPNGGVWVQKPAQCPECAEALRIAQHYLDVNQINLTLDVDDGNWGLVLQYEELQVAGKPAAGLAEPGGVSKVDLSYFKNNPQAVAEVIVHELGHQLSLTHYNETCDNFMNTYPECSSGGVKFEDWQLEIMRSQL